MRLLAACIVWLQVVAGCGFQGRASLDADAGPSDPAGVAYIQSSSGLALGTMASVAASFAQPQRAGHLNIAVVSWVGDAARVVVHDAIGNNYLLIHSAENDGLIQAVFYAANVRAAPANTVTAELSGAEVNPMLRIVEYAGLATDNVLDDDTTDVGSGELADSGDLELSASHALLFAANTSDAMTTGPGTSFTSRMISYGTIVEDREVVWPGTYRAAATLARPNARWIMTGVGFRAAR